MLNFAPWLHFLRGEHAACREYAQRLVALATAQGARTYAVEGAAILAGLDMLADRTRPRLDELHRLLILAQESRTVWRSVASFCLLAEAAAGIGEIDLGLASLAAIADEHRDAFFAPEIQRVRGELLLRRDGPVAPSRASGAR